MVFAEIHSVDGVRLPDELQELPQSLQMQRNFKLAVERCEEFAGSVATFKNAVLAIIPFESDKRIVVFA